MGRKEDKGVIALYIVIAGACCLVAGFLIGFFTKRPSGVNGMPLQQKEIEGLKADIEKEREALSSLRGEKEKAYLENATLSEKCRGYEEQIKGLKEEIESRQSEFDSRLAQQQQEVQKREEDLRSSIEKEFEKNRNLQKEAENRQNSNNEERVKAQAEILNALSPLTGQISSLQDALASAKENRASEVGELKASIEGLKDIEKSIQEENQNFSSLLNNNQLRGRWGEIQLENLVEKCGMSKHVDFDTQLSLSSKGKEGEERGRPDLVVFLPGKGAMPVDAKTPLEKFEEAGEKETSNAGAEYAKVVKKQVDSLSKRDYPKLLLENGFEPLSFTVAYIPVSSWLQGAIASDPDLLNYAFSKNVVLCSSASFWALLQAVSVSWRNWSLEEDAQEIKKLGEELYGSLETFSAYLAKVGSGFKTALEGYNNLVGNVDSRLVPRAKKLRDLGVGHKDFKLAEEIEMDLKTPKGAKKESEENEYNA